MSSTDPLACPSCERDLSYPGAPGHECYTAHDAQVRADERQKVAALLADEDTVEKVAEALNAVRAALDVTAGLIDVIAGLIRSEDK